MSRERLEPVARWQELGALLVPALLFAGLATRQSSPVALAQTTGPSEATALRVCSDPNNLPFSNRAGDGFENRIAELIGRELKLPVTYDWWAQRRGFARNTLNAGDCDLVVGTVSGMEMLSTTRPYYRSTYVFVSRRDRHLGIRSLNDPRLPHLRVGVQLIGDDFSNTPPAHALANRGMSRNIVGYPVYGDYRTPNPPARIVDAVAKGSVDVAIVWGPLAGYFARPSAVPLTVTPVSPQVDLPYLPFVFDIAMGVRRGDSTFKTRIESVITRRQSTIDSILDAYGIPRLPLAPRASP
jgi:mxaJ protein